MNYIEEYYEQIKSGKIITSKRVYKVYSRLVGEIKKPKGKYIYDEDLGNRPIEFIERFCKLSKGKIGKPLKLELFQKALTSAIFGFINKETGERRYKEAMLLIARKNGKTTWAAAIALYMLMADGEGGPECYCIATKKDQAKILFTEATNMIKQSPELSKYLKKRRTDIYCPLNFGKFEPLASDSNSLDGLNSHFIDIDELHAVTDRELYEVMKQSMSARDQPLILITTTAGTIRENIFDDMYKYACEIADGKKIDDRFLPIMYELDNLEEWTDYKCWMKANPGLGTIKKLDDVQEKVARAQQNPVDRQGILCKDFNILTNSSITFLELENINKCAVDMNIQNYTDKYAVGGVDLAETTDLCCATAIIPLDGKLKVVQKYFIAEDRIEQNSKNDQMAYRYFTKTGAKDILNDELLCICEGSMVKRSDITAWFVELAEKFHLVFQKIGYDRWHTDGWLDDMIGYGFPQEDNQGRGCLVPIAMGSKSLSVPMKETKVLFEDGLIEFSKHNGLFRWCCSNTAAKLDVNGNIQPDKARSKARIDGYVSFLIAYIAYKNSKDVFDEFQN